MKKAAFLLIYIIASKISAAQMTTLYHGEPFYKIYELKANIQADFPGYNYCGYNAKFLKFLFMDTSGSTLTVSFTKKAEIINQVQVTGNTEVVQYIWKKYISPGHVPNDKKIYIRNKSEEIKIELIGGSSGDQEAIQLTVWPIKG